MVRHLEVVLGRQARIEWLPEQAGDVPQTWASIEKARDLLGYRPSTTFAEGVSRFVEWLATSDQTNAAFVPSPISRLAV
jgi:UDP-glucuronate 4-epimerase